MRKFVTFSAIILMAVMLLTPIVTTKAEDAGPDDLIEQQLMENASEEIDFSSEADYVSLDEYTYDEDFEAMIANFPDSYKPGLRNLHAIYPNYIFTMDVSPHSFTTVVSKEINKKVETAIDNSWKACYGDNYNWSTGRWISTEGGWTYASKEVVEYFLDPRNFFNSDNVYMFMQQTYSDAQTIEGLRSLLSNTFMARNYTPDPEDPDDVRLGGDYAAVIMEAGQKANVSPYVLAAMIICEQGYSGISELIAGNVPGFEGIYDFYNFGATGTTIDDVIYNGLVYSKKQGWTSRYKSIVGGAENYYNGYLGNNQDTAYYKGYNVLNGLGDFWHQYETSLMGPYSTSIQLSRYYADCTDASLVFRIPVYDGLPENPIPRPKRSDKINNYYFDLLTPSEGSLSPAYNKYTFSYSLNVSDDAFIEIDLLDGTEYKGQTTFNLKQGANEVSLPVMSQTGYTRTYAINVTASKDCTLRVVGTGIPYIKQVNGVWAFAENDVIYTNKNDIIQGVVDGVSGWWKITKGLVDFTCNSIEHNDYGWWYVKDGKVDFSYNGIGKNFNGYWAVRDGQVSFDYTGLFEGTVDGVEALWYFKDSALAKVDTVVIDSDGIFKVSKGKVDTSFNGILKHEGKLYKFKDGRVDTEFEGVDVKDNTWYYFEHGEVTGNKNDIIEITVNGKKAWWWIKDSKVSLESGVGTNKYGTWYIENGMVDFDFSGLVKYGEKLYYFNTGKLDSGFTGFAQYGTDIYYLENGTITGQKNDIIETTINNEKAWWHIENSKVSTGETVAANEYGTWYVKNGKVDFDYTGFASNEEGDWYVEDGRVTFEKNDVINGRVKVENGWWYVKDSKVTYTNTVAQNSYGWWRIKNGRVDFDCNSIEENENGWWVIRNGKVDFGYTGFASNRFGEWYAENGKVSFKVNGFIKGENKGEEAIWFVKENKVIYENSVENNNGTWVAVVEGKLDNAYKGFLTNGYGDWYLENGKVSFKNNDVIFGQIDHKAAWWYVESSKVMYVDTVAHNSNGWWKITDGCVDFGFNGLAANSNGTWVINDGKVDFSYEGAYEYQGKSYKIQGGKVIG